MQADTQVDSAAVKEILSGWPKVSKEAATTTINKYGLPNEASASRLIWHNNGPWRRTVIYAEEVPHEFPTPHHDVLEQYIPYKVPVEKLGELAAFDGSVLIDRTKGEISARCEGEEANFLALNLANEIVQGHKSVDEARDAYGDAMKKMRGGTPPEIMQKLLFDVPSGGTGEPDQPII
ncbi:hypothetical protein [Hyphomicrobium sp.]|uniref:hypothetical protein n=1 Tax=Hyphomicrobium sp. TaxID=82 RepID=UPI002FDE9E30